MPATDALAMRAVFTEEVERGFDTFWEGMVESFKHPEHGEALIMEHATAPDLRKSMLAAVRASETYYVSPDMVKLAIGATKVMPDDAPIQKHSIPTPQGFMWLGAPVRMLDIRGMVVVVNAVLWTVSGPRISIVPLTDKYDPTERKMIAAMAYNHYLGEFPRLSPMSMGGFHFGEPLPETLQWAGAKLYPPEIEIDVVRDPKTGSVSMLIADEGMVKEELHPEAKTDLFAKFLVTTWRLMRQTLVDVREEEQMDKRSRRLAKKHLNDKRHVTIIALRRREHHGRGDREWVLDHRILVRGYSRKQWYGSGEDRWFDYIYIHPHTRGPEDAPLIVTDKINALIR